jgi:hypothetical protein
MTRWLSIAAVLAICQLALILAPIRAAWALLTGNSDRAWEIAKGYDLLANPVFNGRAGEYISGRAHRGTSEGARWACVLCRLLDLIDKDHCKNNQTQTEERAP